MDKKPIMVTMSVPGITMKVLPSDVDLYKRAGYEIIKDEKPAVVDPVVDVETGNEPVIPKNLTEAYKLAKEAKGESLTAEEKAEVKAEFLALQVDDLEDGES